MRNIRANFGCFYANPQNSVDVSFTESYKGSVLENELILPNVIEGADLLDTLIPYNKFTGHRENPLSLLGKITGANADLLNAVLTELPTLKSDPNLSDQDRIDFLVPRLCSGTPAEQALVAENLMKNLDALGLSQKQAESVVDQQKESIEFKNEDVPLNVE